ncbi:MAG: prepilin-type N-terminal cleavage/methylation domain-containing protein [Phycisphaerae bacterium]
MTRRAFTLIELLVVVAIVSLLLAILVPALSAAREQAKATVCQSNLRQVAVGIYNYWTDCEGRVPYVESPMTNGIGCAPRSGSSAPGYGRPCWPDAELDPFDRNRWPMSLPNVLMPVHMGQDPKVFLCPSARLGWPREGGELRYTYREAAANQPNGRRDPSNRYNIEHFGFLDGRMLKNFRMQLTGDPIRDAMEESFAQGVYMRDLIRREADSAIGPHKGGINVINRTLQVEKREQKLVTEQLAPNGFDTGASF